MMYKSPVLDFTLYEKEFIESNTTPTITTKYWMDTSVTPPVLKQYNNGEWVIVGDPSEQLESLRGSVNETIDNTKNDILDEVDNKYASKSEIVTIEDVNLAIEKDRDSLDLVFEGMQKTITDLDGVTKETFEEWKKYIRFEEGNIVLGQLGNELTLKITNEKISFLQAGNEVAYFSNQKLYITDAEILHSLIIGNFAYIPRSNGSLDFKKVR